VGPVLDYREGGSTVDAVFHDLPVQIRMNLNQRRGSYLVAVMTVPLGLIRTSWVLSFGKLGSGRSHIAMTNS